MSVTRVCMTLALVCACTAATRLPSGFVWGCTPGNVSAALPFCDAQLDVDARVDDLISRLTLDEQLGLLGADTVNTRINACNDMDAGVLRLGIPRYMHLVETNSAVASVCLAPDVCSVEWPGPTGLAATFNRTVWRVKGEVVSTEMRAFNNLGGTRGTDDHTTAFIGLDGFGPNINMARDPRWGRNSEVPGECPLLSGQYAAHYVRGMQNGDDARYLKMAAQVKHYALYSVEAGREGFIPANVSMHDLFDYYLPQFRTAFVDGGASGAMCSYAGTNFTPACANAYLLKRVLREHWQQNDTVVSTDCGAIDNFLSAHGSHFAFNRPDAAAKAINGGADVDLGDAYYAPVAVGGNGALATAVQADLVKVAVVRAAVRRVLRRRMRLGQFDPLERQVYTDTRTYGASAVNSTAAHAAVLEATLQSLVLLRNEQATLPLVVGARTALIGPHAVSQRDLMEGYKGDRACYTADGSDSNACVQTLGSVYARMNGAPSLTTVVKGVDIASDDASGIPAALDAAQAADQIILCLGLGQEVERETLDRQRIDLPPLQQKLAQAVLRVAGGKRVVLVLVNGGAVALDNAADFPAIVEAFYPSMRGGEALFLALTGAANRWGRLPITVYRAAFVDEQPMTSFDLTTPPGRTYRYYHNDVTFPFGHGLSYTSFGVDCSAHGSSEFVNATRVSCLVANQGERDGDVVLMAYHIVGDEVRARLPYAAPLRSLVDFVRVAAPVGQLVAVEFVVDARTVSLVDADGDRVLERGAHTLIITDGGGAHAATATIALWAPQSVVLERVPRA